MMEGWQRYWRQQGMGDNPSHKKDSPTLENKCTSVEEMGCIDPYKRG